MQPSITLFSNKENCCGCGACANACPKNAISMKEDRYGFVYPEIDTSTCVECGICQKVCSFQYKEEKHEPIAAFAVSAKDQNVLLNSASGGAFAVLAEKIISEGGAAFGAAFDNAWGVCHICVDSIKDLKKLQGSKYVQSSTGDTYQQVKRYLKQERKVLYSGTPCQIAGLYGYLGKDDENLLTVDLICHGVPNQRMFKDYVHSLGNVTGFSFRDKSLGWGINGKAVIKGNKKPHKLWQSASPYLYYFTQGFIYRDSCYQCKYTCKHRPADLTLGDYWGIEKQHPEYLGKNGFDTQKGISVVIANTKKGVLALQNCSEHFDAKESTFEKAAAGNAQLKRPSAKKSQRGEILELYASHGWNAVAERFQKNIGLRRYSSQIKRLLPEKIKKYLKRLK